MVKIAVVDNELSLLSSIKRNLSLYNNIEIIFTATNGKEALEKIDKDLPDIILMDINMPVMNGIEATAKILKLVPNVKIIMLTVMDAEDVIFDSILAGATGYLMKESPPEKLYQAITECLEGGAPMSPGIAFKAIRLIKGSQEKKHISKTQEDFGLTKREVEILEKIASGQTYKQIGDVLFISPKTVRKHIENIYYKLRVHNKTEAIDLVKRNDIIK